MSSDLLRQLARAVVPGAVLFAAGVVLALFAQTAGLVVLLVGVLLAGGAVMRVAIRGVRPRPPLGDPEYEFERFLTGGIVRGPARGTQEPQRPHEERD